MQRRSGPLESQNLSLIFFNVFTDHNRSATPLHTQLATRRRLSTTTAWTCKRLTETWTTTDAPDANELDGAPPGYAVLHRHRVLSTDRRSSVEEGWRSSTVNRQRITSKHSGTRRVGKILLLIVYQDWTWKINHYCQGIVMICIYCKFVLQRLCSSVNLCLFLFVCLYGYIVSIDEWMNGDEIWTRKIIISK